MPGDRSSARLPQGLARDRRTVGRVTVAGLVGSEDGLEVLPGASGGRGDTAGLSWEYRSPTFGAMDFHFAVRATDAAIGRRIGSVLAPLRVPARPAHWYSIVDRRAGWVDVLLDGEAVARHVHGADALDWVVWDCNRAAVAATPSHLLFHAGGVQAAAGGVLLPGPSGSGKSTLVAALVARGFRYLSDELVGLSPGGRLLPYPRALSLEPSGRRALGDAAGWPRPCEVPTQAVQPTDGEPEAHREREAPDALGGPQEPEAQAGAGETWHVAPDAIRPGAVGRSCRPLVVVAPRYVGSGTTRLRSLSAAQAFVALATSTVNLGTHGHRGTRMLAALADRCACFSLDIADLGEACRLVEEVIVP